MATSQREQSLRTRARKLNITGRSKMNLGDLATAIQAAEDRAAEIRTIRAADIKAARTPRRTRTRTTRVAARLVEPGDRIAGIGLMVETVEPSTDFSARISGYVSTRDQVDGKYELTPVHITFPNYHLVRVFRSAN